MTPALLSESEQRMLTTALSRALAVAASARSTDSALFFQFIVLRDDPTQAPAELRELLNVVTGIPALEIFNHAQQSVLGNRERVSFRFLSQWLVSRAQQVGCDQAVVDLSRYLKADAFDLTVILAVDGVIFDERIELTDYELVSWQELADSDTKWQIALRGSFWGLADSSPSAATQREASSPSSLGPTLHRSSTVDRADARHPSLCYRGCWYGHPLASLLV
jgi:hypothetical protein